MEIDLPSGSGLHVTVDGAVATVLLDRPDRLNAQTPRMWAGLRAAGAALPGAVRVVVVRAAGASFSAGLDKAMFSPGGLPDTLSLADLAAMPEAEAADSIEQFQAAFGWLARADIVSIAAVQGHAVGAGFQLALACDLRVLIEDAQLTMAEVPLGLVPDLGGTRRLIELVGYSRALEICVTGRRVGATEAARIGLANRVVLAEQLSEAVDEIVQAVLKPPVNAVRETKSLLLEAAARSQQQQELAERVAQVRRMRALLSGE